MEQRDWDVIVIGAGAAGMMASITAANQGLSVLVIDHANKPGKKILMSGGGRCNFTNMWTEPSNFVCPNPHFVKSALASYTQWDFIAMVDEHQIPHHEKALGQLFCDRKSKDIVDMLLQEMEQAGAQLTCEVNIHKLRHVGERFMLRTSLGDLTAASVVVATGGLSIPTMGATGVGYELAEQFGHSIMPRRAGLVPFTFSDEHKAVFASLSGNSIEVIATANEQSFREAMLFTHRGLSGPAILQISSFWQQGDAIELNLLPDIDVDSALREEREKNPKRQLKTWLSQWFSKAIIEHLLPLFGGDDRLADLSNQRIAELASYLNGWLIKPSGTEGYRTAEVTLGGVNTDEVSSKTMESKKQPGLYFIGEVLDVSGHLGGFNFQWAWSSAVACGTALANR